MVDIFRPYCPRLNRRLDLEDQDLSMSRNKARKESGKVTLARVKKEMARPRVAKSAQKRYAKLALPVVLTEAGKPPGREAAESHFEGKLLKK